MSCGLLRLLAATPGGLEGILLVSVSAAFPCCIVLRVVLRKIRSGQANSLTPLLLLLGWLSHVQQPQELGYDPIAP